MRQRAVEMYMELGSESLIDSFLASSSDGTTLEIRKVLVAFANQKDSEVTDELDRTKQKINQDKQKNAEDVANLQRQKDALDKRNKELNETRQELDERKEQLENVGKDILAEIQLLQGEEDLLLEILGFEMAGDVPAFIDPPKSASGLIWPTEGVLTSRFGMRWGAMHQGIDIGAPTGTPIYAANDGTVIFSGNQGGYGKMVIIDHGEGFQTAYAHQSRLLAVSGDRVLRGQIIGMVGSTGNSTGPHLHFETRFKGTAVDPLILLPEN
jgi:murein DD-endopeptidase MepM/ murein hydrolase activator NlpD